MRVLLDTHYVLWLANNSERLSRAEVLFVSQAELKIVVSAVSLWELRIKWRRLERDGEVISASSPKLVHEFWSSMGAELIDLTFEHATTPLEYKLPHRDPFDDLLVVQAQQLGVKIFTRDDDILTHPLAIAA